MPVYQSKACILMDLIKDIRTATSDWGICLDGNSRPIRTSGSMFVSGERGVIHCTGPLCPFDEAILNLEFQSWISD